MTRLIAALTLVSLVASCGSVGESRLNPFNWYGGDREERITLPRVVTYADTRPLAAEIVKLKVDRVPGGAIIHAMALPPTQGHWDAELVAQAGEKPDKGTLIYEFRLVPPTTAALAGSKRSREVLVGHFVSDQKLIGVRNIQVIAQANRRTVRR